MPRSGLFLSHGVLHFLQRLDGSVDMSLEHARDVLTLSMGELIKMISA